MLLLFIVTLQYCDRLGQKKSAAGIVVISYEERVEGGFVLFPDLGVYAVTNAGSFYGSLDEAGVFQFFEVLADGSLGKAQFFHQVAADAGLGFDQVLDDGDPRRVGQRLHHGCQFILFVAEYF
jgi:hypothetical protein